MRVAIIGAGLAGLVAAHELNSVEPEAKIEVFEATGRIGGKLYTAAFESGPTDVGAEALLYRRRDAIEYLESLGLGDDLVFPSNAPSLIYSQGRAHTMPRNTVMGIPASSAEVANLVGEQAAQRIDAERTLEPLDWQVGQDVNLGQLVRTRLGDAVADRLVSALLGGVYSCAADDLGLRATVPQLAGALDALANEGEPVTLTGAADRMLSARQPSHDPVFSTLRGGYAQLYELLADKSGADIYLDAFVSGLQRVQGGFQLTGAGEGTYDRVILATPAPTTALLLKSVAPETSAALKAVKLADSVVVAMRFDSAEGLPENSGVLVAADEPELNAKAFTFSSKKWPHLQQRGGAIVRASFGRFGERTALTMDEDTLVDQALDDLQTITGFDGRAAGLSEIFTQRWFGGLPRYDHTHLATVDTVLEGVAQVPGLEVTGAWAGGVGVPAVIADARATARRVI
ncbi:protoporphyrinogen oxidase [Corynebacterium tapiri]|uniref:Protoporphyrinogen oxidase n=1 Tax=Corynebacterium tapiri TaxID=1448266 RepID=A0A5C4U2U2_9CORY|nr:protoporphyrinogen oxidase [Corynebacterium tapiri]TNL97294.1 protoporphyrinogen oxidase [Corynebacterium tapiri]